MNRWLFWWRKLKRELWFRATLYAALAVGAALLAVVAAPWVPSEVSDRFGGESVESILTILASSLLAVATFSVGAMVTAYTSVSQTATPRVAALVTTDDVTQRSLATFVGAFLYAIVAVTAINAQYYGPGGRTILFLFSLVVVGLVAFRLLAWINRLSRLARVGHMIDLAEDRTAAALAGRQAEPWLGGRPGRLADGADVTSETTGYVQNVDSSRLQKVAESFGCEVEVCAQPGAFVRRGGVLARISAPASDPEVQKRFRSGFALGRSRSFDQDPRFGLTVLGEIAGKALSPGVNDPGTAIQVIGAGVRLIDGWLQGGRTPGEPACSRVLAGALSEADLLDDVFGPAARYGAGDVAVMVRLQKAMRLLQREGGPVSAAAARMGEEAIERARNARLSPADLARIESAAG